MARTPCPPPLPPVKVTNGPPTIPPTAGEAPLSYDAQNSVLYLYLEGTGWTAYEPTIPES